jgi:hypothetical protein
MGIDIISAEEAWTSRKGKSPLLGTQEWKKLSKMLLAGGLQPGETVRIRLSKKTRGLVNEADELLRRLLISRFSPLWKAGKIPQYRITTSGGVLYVGLAKEDDPCELL